MSLPFELNLDEGIREEDLELHSSNSIIEVNWERKWSILPPLSIELKKKSTSNPISINFLIQLKNLSIIISKDLYTTSMSQNLPIFKKTRDDDPITYIKRFMELFIISLIINLGYYLL